MKKIFYLFMIIMGFSCQKMEEPIFDPSAKAPEIASIVLDKEVLKYNEKAMLSADIYDDKGISHVEIRLVANNSILYSKVVPGNKQKEMKLEEEIGLQFGRLSDNTVVSVTVIATNIDMKTTESSYNISLIRPVFDKLYLVVAETNEEFVLSKDNDNLSEQYIYKSDVDLPNNTNVYIYSETNKQGLVWGFDKESEVCALNSSEPIPLFDSENVDNKVEKVVFNAYSFEVSPLKKGMMINDVLFMPYKKNASDENFVDATLRANNVSLVNGEEVYTELIDLDIISFDPDFFNIENNKLIYTGQTGIVTLYLNTKYNFVFVESQDNPLVTTSNYPYVLFVNG